jgi:hypothetical protein
VETPADDVELLVPPLNIVLFSNRLELDMKLMMPVRTVDWLKLKIVLFVKLLKLED